MYAFVVLVVRQGCWCDRCDCYRQLQEDYVCMRVLEGTELLSLLRYAFDCALERREHCCGNAMQRGRALRVATCDCLCFTEGPTQYCNLPMSRTQLITLGRRTVDKYGDLCRNRLAGVPCRAFTLTAVSDHIIRNRRHSSKNLGSYSSPQQGPLPRDTCHFRKTSVALQCRNARCHTCACRMCHAF